MAGIDGRRGSRSRCISPPAPARPLRRPLATCYARAFMRVVIVGGGEIGFALAQSAGRGARSLRVDHAPEVAALRAARRAVRAGTGTARGPRPGHVAGRHARRLHRPRRGQYRRLRRRPAAGASRRPSASSRARISSGQRRGEGLAVRHRPRHLAGGAAGRRTSSASSARPARSTPRAFADGAIRLVEYRLEPDSPLAGRRVPTCTCPTAR